MDQLGLFQQLGVIPTQGETQYIWGEAKTAAAGSPSGVEANKAIIRRYFEGFNKWNVDVIRETLAPDHVYHHPPFPDSTSLDDFIEEESALKNAFPDRKATIEDLVAEGDKVACRVTISGTHTGAMGDIAPTGKRITATSIIINCLKDAKIVESWESFDYLGVFQQLGVIPPLGEE
jgi:steroid delta-isomerase-like uncharacterized protein